MTVRNLIDARERDAIAQLQFFARGVVEGLTAGRHRSPHKGASIEFKEHRQYVRGDEIRSIDWKLFGKTDRLFIRQYEDETNLRAMMLIDQSGSMNYAGTRSGGQSKHGFAIKLAACFATLLIRQQDAVGIATLDTEVRATLPTRSNPGHLHSLCQTLVDSQPGGETSLGEALKQTVGKIRRRGLIALFSDCFDSIEAMMSALRYFRHQGHEVIVFRIWDLDEVDFPFRNRTQFRSLENSQKHIVDPNALRQTYLRKAGEFARRLETETAKERIELVSCTSGQTCGEVLGDLLARRGGGGQRGARASGSGARPAAASEVSK